MSRAARNASRCWRKVGEKGGVGGVEGVAEPDDPAPCGVDSLDQGVYRRRARVGLSRCGRHGEGVTVGGRGGGALRDESIERAPLACEAAVKVEEPLGQVGERGKAATSGGICPPWPSGRSRRSKARACSGDLTDKARARRHDSLYSAVCGMPEEGLEPPTRGL
jgi:hypothetical protein